MLKLLAKESESAHTFPAWASIILSTLFVIAYFSVLRPASTERHEQIAKLHFQLEQCLNQQFQEGSLKEKFWILAKEEPHIINAPEYNLVFTAKVKNTYRALEQVPPPLIAINRSTPLKRLSLCVTAHHDVLLALGIICLLLAGFVFEHLYDRLIVWGLFVMSSCGWLVLSEQFETPFLPSPVFAWSFGLAVLLLVLAGTAPRAKINLAIGRNFFGPQGLSIELPITILPLLFISALLLSPHFNTDYAPLWSWPSLIGIPLQAFLFLIPFRWLPRKPEPEIQPKQFVNENLARADLLFREERMREGLLILRKCMANAPSNAQLRRIAAIAGAHHQTELANQCYQILLKHAFLKGASQQKSIDLVFETLSLGFKVPIAYIAEAFRGSVRHGSLEEIRKLLPYTQDHQEMSEKERDLLYDEMVDEILAKQQPNKVFLLEIEKKLEQVQPNSAALTRIRGFLAHEITKQEKKRAVPLCEYLEIALLELTPSGLRLRTPNSGDRNIPWSAIATCIAWISHEGLPKACFFIEFQQRIYACIFSEQRIFIKDAYNKNLSFEKTWDLLAQIKPNGLPIQWEKKKQKTNDMNQEQVFLGQVWTRMRKDFGK